MCRAFACALVTALTSASFHAAASEPTERVAAVVIAGDEREAAIVRASVGEQLERLGVHAETAHEPTIATEEITQPHAAEGQVVARVWIDSRSEAETVLYITDATGSRILVRHFPREGRSELAREAMMATLQTNVGALLRGDAIGVSRSEAREQLGLPAETQPEAVPAAAASGAAAPPPTKKPAPPPRSSSASAPWTLGLAFAYEVGAYAGRHFEHGPMLALSLARPFGGIPIGLTLSGQYRFPIVETQDPSTLRLESAAFRAQAFVTPWSRDKVELRVSAGAGVDVVRAEPGLVRVVEATLRPTNHADTVFRAGVALRAPAGFFPSARVQVEAALDVAPFVSSYAVARDGARADLISPWIARPLVLVGFALDENSKKDMGARSGR